MNRTLFLLGPSDLEEQNRTSTETSEAGVVKVEADLSGVLPILPFVMQDKRLRANSEVVLLGVHRIRLPKTGRVNLFNVVGDADSSMNMLRTIRTLEDRVKPQRCFNRPDDVMKTSRAQLPKTLAGIPGCIAPRAEIAHPKSLGELQEVCSAFGNWPMIVRALGRHGGKEMLLLHDPGQLEAFKDTSWLYTGLCLIEFVDYQDGEGLYQKNRVIMVDGVPYPRHALISDRWLIHAGSRLELMNDDRELCRREEKFLANDLARHTPVFQQIYQRIGLDVFGIDYALVDDQVVIFEANACMQFLDRQYRSDNRYLYLDGYVKSLKRAVKKMLLNS